MLDLERQLELSGCEADIYFLYNLLMERIGEFNQYLDGKRKKITQENWKRYYELSRRTFEIAGLLKKIAEKTERSQEVSRLYDTLVKLDRNITRRYKLFLVKLVW